MKFRLLWWKKPAPHVPLMELEEERMRFDRTTQGGMKFDIITVGRDDPRKVGSYIFSGEHYELRARGSISVKQGWRERVGKVLHETPHRGGMGYRDLWVQWGHRT